MVFTLVQSIPTETNDLGIASASLTLTPGIENSITVSFAGDEFHEPSSDSQAFSAVDVFPARLVWRLKSRNVHRPDPRSWRTAASSRAAASRVATPGFGMLDPLSLGNSGVVEPLAGYDTLVLNGVCDIGSASFLGNATFRSRIRDFVDAGGKLVIWDSECTNTDYSQFFLPFTTNNPGARGATGTLTIVEENTLSNSDPGSPSYLDVALIGSRTDAAGDANVFLTYDPNWCVDMLAVNTVGDE